MGLNLQPPPRGDPATEWRRSNPDIVVYIPKGGGLNDGDNEHFLVFEAPSGDLLAMWTQSSVEGHGDNHIVIARSKDGVTWSEPKWIAGRHPNTRELQASWGFPVVSKQGRIYCFYVKEVNVGTPGGVPGLMGCAYSDDDGKTWIHGDDIELPKTRFDHPDPSIPHNWIVFQKPIRDSKGRWMVGYTHWTSETLLPERSWYRGGEEDRCRFMRFDNIDDRPDLQDIEITLLPLSEEGLTVPHPFNPDLSYAAEPSITLLLDGRIFSIMHTLTGYIWYSVSDDDGEHWRDPEILRYTDYDKPIRHPVAPCAIYALQDGRSLLLFHNNDGNLGPYSQWYSEWPFNMLSFIRRPAFIAVGEFRPDAHQPIWFSDPKQILDTDGIPVGPKGTAEIATYTSLTERKGRRVLWYPDRKYYLLGKYITIDRSTRRMSGGECTANPVSIDRRNIRRPEEEEEA